MRPGQIIGAIETRGRTAPQGGRGERRSGPVEKGCQAQAHCKAQGTARAGRETGCDGSWRPAWHTRSTIVGSCIQHRVRKVSRHTVGVRMPTRRQFITTGGGGANQAVREEGDLGTSRRTFRCDGRRGRNRRVKKIVQDSRISRGSDARRNGSSPTCTRARSTAISWPTKSLQGRCGKGTGRTGCRVPGDATHRVHEPAGQCRPCHGEKGPITIRSGRRAKRWLEFSDTGSGIRGHRQKISSPLTTKPVGRAPAGLRLAYGISEAQRPDRNAERGRKGSTFSITLITVRHARRPMADRMSIVDWGKAGS